MSLLFKHTAAEHVDLLFCEETPVASAQILLGQAGKLHAVEACNTVTEVLKDAANDAVLATMYLDSNLFLVVLIGIFNRIGVDFAVFQLNSGGNLLQVVFRNNLIEPNMIDLLLQELGMCELAGQISVVSQQEYASRIAVQATHRIDSFGASVLYKVHNYLALLRIVAGCHVIFGLVQQHIDLLFERNRLIMELDFVGTEHLRTQFGDNVAVYADHSGLNELVSLAT